MSIKRNIIYSISLNCLNVIFPVVTIPYISRVLGAENIGIINFSANYAGYFVMIAALGVNYYGVREIAKYREDRDTVSSVFSGIFLINIASSFFASIFYIFTVIAISGLRENALIFILMGVTIYLTPFSIDWYFQGLEHFKTITVRSVIVKCVSFISLFLFVRRREAVIPYVCLHVFSMVGTYVWNLVYAFNRGLRIKITNVRIKEHIKPMLIFFVANVSISIFMALDTVMLGFLGSYEQVAFYTQPNKIVTVLSQGIGSINIAILPRFSFNTMAGDSGANKKLLQKVIDLNIFLLLPISLGFYLIAPRFVPLFFGKEFIDCVIPMQVLSFKLIGTMLTWFFGAIILVGLGHEKKYLIVTSVIAFVSFVLNLLFIPKYGAIGVTMVSSFTTSLGMMLSIFCVYKFTKIRLNYKMAAPTLFCTVFLFVLFISLNQFIVNDFLFMFCFIGVSVVVYCALQTICKNYLINEVVAMVKNRIVKRY
jgi:O-antigen/teichoic acid export membrane protein